MMNLLAARSDKQPACRNAANMLLAAAIFIAALLAGHCLADDEDDAPDSKSGLKALNDFIGDWKGSGAPDKPRSDPKDSWEETLSWSWRFKGSDAWLTLSVKNGRLFKSGELRYLPEKKRYQFTAVDLKKKKLSYEGALHEGYLTLERVDPSTKETQRLMMNSAGEGIRFIYKLAHKSEGRTLFTKDYQVASTKVGESFAAKEKKVECPVSGGLGTIPVSYMGKTYYVCCSGCRDAFNENPAKYVKALESKKK